MNFLFSIYLFLGHLRWLRRERRVQHNPHLRLNNKPHLNINRIPKNNKTDQTESGTSFPKKNHYNNRKGVKPNPGDLRLQGIHQIQPISIINDLSRQNSHIRGLKRRSHRLRKHPLHFVLVFECLSLPIQNDPDYRVYRYARALQL